MNQSANSKTTAEAPAATIWPRESFTGTFGHFEPGIAGRGIARAGLIFDDGDVGETGVAGRGGGALCFSADNGKPAVGE
jgi:hypothetical protein